MKPCERFTILDWRQGENAVKCDVCDHLEDAHENPGQRRLSGGEIEDLRRRMLMENFDRQQEDRSSDRPPGTNSQPFATDS